MRAVILSGGGMSDYDRCKNLIAQEDLVICADAGYNHAVAMGVTPDVVLGDFDSVAYESVNCGKKIRYPSMKDETDTEIAIEYALENGYRDIVIMGAEGGRVDHYLANIFLLAKIMRAGACGCMYDAASVIYMTDSEIALSGKPGDLLSVIALTPWARGITNHGLQYPLCDFDMEFGAARGISNVFAGEKARIEVKDGILLVVVTPQ